MEKCPLCKQYVYTDLKFHTCKTKWFCFDADTLKEGELPTIDEFISYGTSVLADDAEEAAEEYLKWLINEFGDGYDEANVLVLEKEDRIHKFFVEAEIVREYNTSKIETIELKIDDTKDQPKLFEL